VIAVPLTRTTFVRRLGAVPAIDAALMALVVRRCCGALLGFCCCGCLRFSSSIVFAADWCSSLLACCRPSLAMLRVVLRGLLVLFCLLCGRSFRVSPVCQSLQCVSMHIYLMVRDVSLCTAVPAVLPANVYAAPTVRDIGPERSDVRSCVRFAPAFHRRPCVPSTTVRGVGVERQCVNHFRPVDLLSTHVSARIVGTVTSV
jgi:hypothetical protein